ARTSMSRRCNQAATRSTRLRMEFTFQVATRTMTNLCAFPDSPRAARLEPMDVDARLRELGIELPEPAAPGRGARSAVGQAALPFDIAVEIEAVVLTA